MAVILNPWGTYRCSHKHSHNRTIHVFQQLNFIPKLHESKDILIISVDDVA
jgi:hypothetical protein